MTAVYSEDIIQLCRWLRKNATLAEQEFWKIVRNPQIDGKKFFRQYPIAIEDEEERIFIADFFCRTCRLVMEIDGGIHETQRDYDRLRTSLLNMEGIRVIRFSNEDVVNNREKVRERLIADVQENTSGN